MENKLFEKELSREYPFKGKIFDVAVCKAELPDGTQVRRDVVCHSGGVCVLPIDDDGMVTMVRQYRYGVGCVTLEIPAGKLEAGEDPLEAIIRELSEETGYTADEIIPLHVDYSSPAILSEVIYIYLARGLHGGKQHLDEGEYLEIEKYHLSELVDMVMAGEITDGKTQIAVLKAARMIEGIYKGLHRDFTFIRHYYSLPSEERSDKEIQLHLQQTMEHIHLARRILPLLNNPLHEPTLYCCINHLLNFLDEGDEEKIVFFADAIHNVPTQMEWNFRLSVSFMEGQFSDFERRYGKTYLAKVWNLNQPNRKSGWFRK